MPQRIRTIIASTICVIVLVGISLISLVRKWDANYTHDAKERGHRQVIYNSHDNIYDGYRTNVPSTALEGGEDHGFILIDSCFRNGRNLFICIADDSAASGTVQHLVPCMAYNENNVVEVSDDDFDQILKKIMNYRNTDITDGVDPYTSIEIVAHERGLSPPTYHIAAIPLTFASEVLDLVPNDLLIKYSKLDDAIMDCRYNLDGINGAEMRTKERAADKP